MGAVLISRSQPKILQKIQKKLRRFISAISRFLHVCLGEANVFQESLDSFFEIAEELKLKGLMGQKEDDAETEINKKYSSIQEQVKSKMSFHERRKYSSSIGNMASSLNTKFNDQSQVVPINNEQRMSLPIFVSGDFKELDEKVKSLMEKGQTTIPSGKNANGTPKQATSRICKVCGKEGAGIAIRDHIEANHLEGVSLPCNVCGKVFRSRARLRKHNC